MNHFVGHAIRGYELRERLGQGAFGEVYGAWQPSVGRDVAIKIISRAYANQPEFIRRFEAEAQLIARLEHPHIVPLYDYWRDPGGAYLVMRYLRGGNLRTELARGPARTDRVVLILDQLASALDHAHRRGVVHRDIKPDNILLDEDGNVYLTDFGIAKIMWDSTLNVPFIENFGEDHPTSSNQVTTNDIPEKITIFSDSISEQLSDKESFLGSLGYISPEQARGEPVTPRSDQYGLSIIIYELLTGAHPYPASTPIEQVKLHKTEQMPSISMRCPDLSFSIDEIFERASAKKPEERFASITEFASAFRSAATGVALSTESTAHPPAVIPETSSNPYKGLRAFEEADADDFFGRDVLIHKLLDRMSNPHLRKTRIVDVDPEPYRFLAVVGPSGSGKSSVVNAGILPMLHKGFLPGSGSWLVALLHPGTNPFTELESALLRVAAKPVEHLREQLRNEPKEFSAILKKILPDENYDLVLVVDQFEELFTQAISEDDRTRFLDLIETAVTLPDSRLRVIITLRADFYDRPLMYAKFGRLVQERTEIVLPLSPSELEQAIDGPAERAGVSIERGLVAEIIADVSEQPGALPLLQYTLTELFERREGQVMTRTAYKSLGGVWGTLARRADELYQTLPDEGRKAARLLFSRLVTPGEGTEDTRRCALRSELDPVSSHMGQVIEIFGRARLLSFDRDPVTRSPTVELAHEALIREWFTLREWLNEDRDSLRLQRHLTQAAQEWHHGGRDRGDLYRGARLVQAREWSEAHKNELNPIEHEFLEASIAQAETEEAEREAYHRLELEAAHKLAATEKARAEEHALSASKLRQRGRMLAMALAIASILLITALGLGSIANKQRMISDANYVQSERLRLAAQASTLLLSGSNIEAAPLLSIQSLKLGYSTEADSTLQRAMTFSYPIHKLIGHNGAVYAVAFSPDSKIVATASTDGTARTWDVATGKSLNVFSGHTDTVASIAFSPDGKTLAASSDDMTIRLWDVSSTHEIKSFRGHTDIIWSIAFAPDGKRLASASYDYTLRIWDVETGVEALRIDMPTTSSGVAFSPDGQFVLSAGDDGAARLYDSSSGILVHEYHGSSLPVVVVAYAHNGKYIATGSNDKTARIWDVESGEEMTRLEGHRDSIYGIAFSPDDQYLFTASYDRTAILWDRETGTIIRRFVGQSGSLYGGAFSADGKWIATASFDHSVWLWSSGLAPDPNRFLHKSPVTSISISKDHRLMLTGEGNGTAHLWDLQTGIDLRTLSGHEFGIESVALSPDARHALTGSDDYTARYWDISTGEQLFKMEVPGGSVWAVRITPDGRYGLVGSDDGIVRLWNLASGEQVREYDNSASVYGLSISPDGRRFLAGTTAAMIEWDINDGTKTYEFPSETSSVFSVTYSPDGRYGALGGHSLVLFDLVSGTQIREFGSQTGAIFSLAFSPDGKRLLSGSEDGTARLWDVETGTLLRVISGDQTIVNAVAFMPPDGNKVLIGGADDTVWVWDVDYQALTDFACSRLTRDLTAEERNTYSLQNAPPSCPQFVDK
jgi:WD40 repeat protein/serine/threonine protein kinase